MAAPAVAQETVAQVVELAMAEPVAALETAEPVVEQAARSLPLKTCCRFLLAI
jgi:hypothetical protein